MLTFGLLSGAQDPQDMIQRALVWLPLAVIALSLHEYGHAAAASALGDDTAKNLGRLTLNPLAHLDLFGTLMLLFGPIGWAKPVPIDPRNLKGRHADMLVSFAGPAMNLILALLAAAVLKYGSLAPDSVALELMASFFLLNVGLAVFNMLPIPPLDGSYIWPAILPGSMRPAFHSLLPYGIILLVFIAMWPGAGGFLSQLTRTVARGLFGLLP